MVVERANDGHGVIAFDNTGMLSDPVVEGTEVRDDTVFHAPVPEIPEVIGDCNCSSRQPCPHQ